MVKYLKKISKHPRMYKSESGRKAILIGATGATGRQLMKLLLSNDNWESIISIGRKPALDGKSHNKLQDITIDSFDSIDSTRALWEGNDVFFNCIGTTRKRAGSAKAFINIERGISMKAAKLALSANIPHASLISAAGANPKQWSVDWFQPLLYMKTIGEKEQTILKHNKFMRTSIFKPGMLIRDSNQESWSAKIKESSNLGLRVNTLAKAMLRDAESSRIVNDVELPVLYVGNSCIKNSIVI